NLNVSGSNVDAWVRRRDVLRAAVFQAPMLPRLLLAPLLAGLLAPASSVGATGPCNPDGSGPVCQLQFGTVPRTGGVNDGDTIDARVGGSIHHVRFVGVQAQELTRYSVTPSKWRGECHAVAAANFVEKIVRQGGYRVRLSAQHPRSDSIGRWERSLAFRIGGRWRDLGEMEMARGLTLWLHNTTETAWNQRYNLLGQQAALKGIGLWNPTTCGSGPAQDVPFKVWVMSDPVGDDAKDINSEYVRIQNRSPSTSVSLAGWYMSDAGRKDLRFHFPADARLGPGQTLTIHSGHGQASGLTFYRNLDGTQFENSANGGGAGDGAYLFDPKGDLRAHMTYPCLVACSDPNLGALRVTANATRGPEYVLIHNVSERAVDLFGYELRLPGGYGFGPDSVLRPGETMTVAVEGNPANDTRLSKHIGYGGAYLPDSGGTASVTTFDEIVLACDSWGSGHC
ncbi:MAG: competence protein ComEC, partial [Solirubrobacteraceae bacterium]|nr:competence protein ComEC [Solirubrobacteraceae bacterium]